MLETTIPLASRRCCNKAGEDLVKRASQAVASIHAVSAMRFIVQRMRLHQTGFLACSPWMPVPRELPLLDLQHASLYAEYLKCLSAHQQRRVCRKETRPSAGRWEALFPVCRRKTCRLPGPTVSSKEPLWATSWGIFGAKGRSCKARQPWKSLHIDSYRTPITWS